jgi:vacuolar-type H+-ATPase subunit I/STV1
MLKVLASLFLFAAATLLLSSQLNKVEPAYACLEPIAYTVGIFDRRFGLTYGEFLEVLAEAEAVWEAPSGRNLFSYEPERAKLPVNLVYDYRQEVTRELSELEGELNQSESAYRALEARYASLKSEHEAMLVTFNSRHSALERRNAAYEASVDAWNAGQRNSKSEFEALERERLAINAEVEDLRRIENNLNRRVREINTLVERLNRLARTLNLTAQDYNLIGASRGETFEGGVYYVDERGAGIDIYEFSSREKLVRILAHELGHALGLEHLEDTDAIMYKYNQSDIGKASSADLDALEILCRN